MLVRGEKEAARLRVFEPREQRFGEVAREIEIRLHVLALQKLEQRGDQKCVIVQVGAKMRPAVLVSRKKPPVAPHSQPNVLERTPRRINPVRASEGAAGARHAEDHERVP